MLHELCGAFSDFRVETGESLRRAGKGRVKDPPMRRRVSDHSTELSRYAWASARPTCISTVWELTAYTNGYVILTGRSSGELHLPIRKLGVSYGLVSLAELPPPIKEEWNAEWQSNHVSVPRKLKLYIYGGVCAKCIAKYSF